MADVHQVWESHDGWKALGLRYFVHQDFDKQPDISSAFDLVISARALGIQVGQAIVNPLQNTNPVDLNCTVGTIRGQLDNWQGVGSDGKPAAWTAGGLTQATFLLTLDIDITIPPFGGKITVKGFHKPCTVLLHWDSQANEYVYMPTP
jgi:hypothetical protein